MNELKHTPGPWVCDPRGGNASVHGVERRAVVDGCGCCGSPYGADNNEEHAANMSLIAAAPDMLAALIAASETLRQVCEGQHPDNVCCHDLRAVEAAIAKASGSAS